MATTHTTIDSPVGELTLVGEDGALAAVYFPGHWTRPDRSRFGKRTDAGLEEAARQLDEYFAGERTTFELATRTHGDPFQARVWALIRDIPYGETRSYGTLAAALGDVTLARAVGRAVGSNPLSIVVPCHRVVGADGSLTGYGGGLERKRFLLDLERPAEARPLTLFDPAPDAAVAHHPGS